MEPRPRLDTQAGVLLFAEKIMSIVRQNFERDGELRPVAFVIHSLHPETGRLLPEPVVSIMPLDFNAETPEEASRKKDIAAFAMRKMCRDLKASTIMTAAEVWMSTHSPGSDSPTKATTPEEFADWYEAMMLARQSRLQEYSKREEGILVIIESHHFTEKKSMQYIAMISRKSPDDSRPTLGEWTLKEGYSHAEDRMVNILPPR